MLKQLPYNRTAILKAMFYLSLHRTSGQFIGAVGEMVIDVLSVIFELHVEDCVRFNQIKKGGGFSLSSKNHAQRHQRLKEHSSMLPEIRVHLFTHSFMYSFSSYLSSIYYALGTYLYYFYFVAYRLNLWESFPPGKSGKE